MNTDTTNTDDVFFQEYTSPDAIRKYSRATAGTGIGSLLEHEYKDIYLDALRLLPEAMQRAPLRILEFGCGAGMNLLQLVGVLGKEGFRIEEAVGTDFSPVLIEAAKKEARSYLGGEGDKVSFYVGKNETLVDDLSNAIGRAAVDLERSFHFVIGVNTFRYCHRAGKELDCARDIFRLLAPGGVCANIDMNDRFPAFRSAVKNKLKGTRENEQECFLPSLKEYTDPFRHAGFNVVRSETFCWVPHSAGSLMTTVMRTLTPVLNTVARSRAMRSLVVAQKPA